jgi:hypothetical protein
MITAMAIWIGVDRFGRILPRTRQITGYVEIRRPPDGS